MDLGSCISCVIHQDHTITNVIITPTCLRACSDYEPNKSDDDDDSLDALNMERSGSREWFGILGVKFARLTNLTQLTFDGVDPDDEDLEQFWGEISGCTSLTSLYYTNMNLENSEEILVAVSPPNLSCITFQGCTIPHDIGCFLHQEGQEEPNKFLTTLRFIECSFNNTNTIREILEFATELAHLTSITTFWFTSCLFDTVQSMCLVRCLTEDRVNTGHVQIYCNTIYEAGNSKVEL
jgi:hypothetical protein